MKYYIDFSSWVVEADNENDAFKRARVLMSQGNIPQINSCCDSADADNHKGEVIETEDLYDVTGVENHHVCDCNCCGSEVDDMYENPFPISEEEKEL